MFDFEKLISDPYDRKARLTPALLAILPLVAMVLLIYPGIESKWAVLLGVIVSFGGAMWLTQVGRDYGKKLEPYLFKKWGGKPSVILLRHRCGELPDATRVRYHATLNSLVSNLHMPTAAQEMTDPVHADQIYEAANSWLLAKTRDHKKFHLLFEENMNYGFRRNFWALKPLAITLDLVILVGFAVFFAVSWKGGVVGTVQYISAELWVGIGATAMHMLIIALLISEHWVRLAAHAYATQLLAACDVLYEPTLS